MNVFISYQRADALYAAHALKYALRVAGHDAFVDTGGIDGGESFRDAIVDAVSRSALVFALIGPAFDVARLSEADNVVTFEWRRAHFHRVPVVPVLIDERKLPSDAELPPTLRWFTRRNALALRSKSLSKDLETCAAAVATLGQAARRAARVLWIDDHPEKNERERRMLRPHGIVFDNVVSTSEALDQIETERYDLVITDLGRSDSSDGSGLAGADFLTHDAIKKGGPPVVIYTSSSAMRLRDDLIARGALDVTADRPTLLTRVLDVLGRGSEVPERLTR